MVFVADDIQHAPHIGICFRRQHHWDASWSQVLLSRQVSLPVKTRQANGLQIALTEFFRDDARLRFGLLQV